MSGISVEIPKEYGYVILTAVSGCFVVMYKAIKVGMARKKYGIEPPTMYASGNEKDAKMFNCVQRAHLNTVEIFPQTMMCMLLGGIQHPLICSGAGIIWLISRIFYAHGYYTGVPGKRSRGAFGYFATLALYGSSISFALRLLGYIN